MIKYTDNKAIRDHFSDRATPLLENSVSQVQVHPVQFAVICCAIIR
jgi:hypothetical protein